MGRDASDLIAENVLWSSSFCHFHLKKWAFEALLSNWRWLGTQARLAGVYARQRSSFFWHHQKKESKEKASLLPVPLRFAAGKLRCARQGASQKRAALAKAQTLAAKSVVGCEQAHAALGLPPPLRLPARPARKSEQPDPGHGFARPWLLSPGFDLGAGLASAVVQATALLGPLPLPCPAWGQWHLSNLIAENIRCTSRFGYFFLKRGLA